jgi:hypothetical protein
MKSGRWTEPDLNAALDALNVPAADTPRSSRDNVVPLEGRRAVQFDNVAHLPDMCAAAQQGVRSSWFSALPPADKDLVVKACLDAIDNRIRDSYDRWRDICVACRDAEAEGAAGAISSFVDWSCRGANFTDDASVRRLWESCHPRPGGITVATLIYCAQESGADLSQWRRPNVDVEGANDDNSGRHPEQRNTVPRWRDTLPVMDVETAGANINQHFGFAHDIGGRPGYFRRSSCGKVQQIDQTELAMTLAPFRVVVTGGERKLLSAFKWWTTWPGRYTVDRVVYDPESRLAKPGEIIENLWQGYAITPKQGPWRCICLHLLLVVWMEGKTSSSI